jgi:hypothetical protein
VRWPTHLHRVLLLLFFVAANAFVCVGVMCRLLLWEMELEGISEEPE